MQSKTLLLILGIVLSSCWASKKISVEPIDQDKTLLIYLLKTKGEAKILNIYILNNTNKELIQYYLYKDQCDFMEKRIAGPIIKKEKRTFTDCVFTTDTSWDTPLSEDDRLVLAKSKNIFDSLQWCSSFKFDSIMSLKIIKTITK